MLIFRALFWVGVVALLMPREPDLGVGRPGATELSARTPVPAGLSWLGAFQDKAIRGLAAVKADIEANRTPFNARAL